jgi:hypothetical protein
MTIDAVNVANLSPDVSNEDNNQPNNPLQLGQTLFEMLDATIVAKPKDKTNAFYNRVVFNSQGGKPQEAVDLGKYDDIVDVKAVTDMHVGKQQVFILTKTGLLRIGSNGNSPQKTAWRLDTSKLIAIIDLNPERTETPVLLLVGKDDRGIFILPFDCQAGIPENPIYIPGLTGIPQNGLLIRCQLDGHLILCTINNSRIIINDLGNSILKKQLFDSNIDSITSIDLGSIQNDARVSCVTAAMLANNVDRQLMVAFPDANGNCQITVLSYDKNRLVRLTTLTPDLSFAPPERPVFRLATGDLLVNNVEQSILGYIGTYGSVSGCAVLLMMELTADTDSDPVTLKILSHYAAANENQQPFASIDLHLAAGLFGGTIDNTQKGVLGVMLLGAAAAAEQLFAAEASILAGLVTVDPINKAFPAMQPGIPGTPQKITTLATIDADTSSFFGLPSDVTGLSVVLGPPQLSQAMGKSQILAIIQAPPYELEGNISTNKPMLTFSQSDNKMEGYNVSSNKMWMFSNDTGVNIGISGQTLGHNVNNSYGNGFDKLDDSSTSTLVQISTSIIDNDLLVLYSMNYYIWTYPVLRKSQQETSDGNLVVIFPMSPSPIQTFVPLNTKSFGFLSVSQNGSLLSYINVPRDGFKPENLLFSQESFPVTQDSAGTTVIFDKNQTIGENINKIYTVHNSASDNAHFSFSQTLFDYIPISFGLNLSNSSTYSESNMETTTLSHNTMMSITISSGSVSDIGYEYQILPYIYQHDTMGCLMVNYDVELLGDLWTQSKLFRLPQVMLIAPYASSGDLMLAHFSRSITFKKKKDGTVDINVSIFNNSLITATDITCEVFLGAPIIENLERKVTPPEDLLGTMKIDELKPTGRGTVSLNATLKENDRVTVNVYYAGLSMLSKVYWGVYPLAAFADGDI